MKHSKRKRYIHKNFKSSYEFRPRAGTEHPRYRCPFCGFMVHAKRFMDLNIPVIDGDVIFYGGYRNLRVFKLTMTSDMRLRVLAAMQQKIEWLHEKLGGDSTWLKSKSALIRAAPSSSSWMMENVSKPGMLHVAHKLGQIKRSKTGIPL